eukprot:6188798-Pleurochrysis_carterae.AAC.2
MLRVARRAFTRCAWQQGGSVTCWYAWTASGANGALRFTSICSNRTRLALMRSSSNSSMPPRNPLTCPYTTGCRTVWPSFVNARSSTTCRVPTAKRGSNGISMCRCPTLLRSVAPAARPGRILRPNSSRFHEKLPFFSIAVRWEWAKSIKKYGEGRVVGSNRAAHRIGTVHACARSVPACSACAALRTSSRLRWRRRPQHTTLASPTRSHCTERRHGPMTSAFATLALQVSTPDSAASTFSQAWALWGTRTRMVAADPIAHAVELQEALELFDALASYEESALSEKQMKQIEVGTILAPEAAEQQLCSEQHPCHSSVEIHAALHLHARARGNKHAK